MNRRKNYFLIIVGLLLVVSVASLTYLGLTHRKDADGIKKNESIVLLEEGFMRIYSQNEDGENALEEQHKVDLEEILEARLIGDRYIVYTYSPIRSPGVSIMAFLDRYEEVEDLSPQAIFEDVPGESKFDVRNAFLAPQDTSDTGVLTFDINPFGFYAETYTPDPADHVTLLYFDTMKVKNILLEKETEVVNPIGYSEDGTYFLFEKNEYLIKEGASNEYCVVDGKRVCAEALISAGFLIVDIEKGILVSLEHKSDLDIWIEQEDVVFNNYGPNFDRWIR